MAGSIDPAGWQQALVCGGVIGALVFGHVRLARAQRQVACRRLKRDCRHERLSDEERVANFGLADGEGRCALADEPALDIARPPSWWHELEWKSAHRR